MISRWCLTLAVTVSLVLTASCLRAAEKDAFRVTVSGAGPDVLLVPGLASSMEVWEETAAHLNGDYRVHRFTLAGFAGVPPVLGPVLDPRAGALLDYIEKEQLTEFAVVGHSLGGVLAMLMATRAPEKLKALVIVDSLPFVAQLFFRSENVESARLVADNLRAVQRAQPAAFYFQQQKAALAGLTKRREKLPQLGRWLETSDKDTLIDALHEMFTLDLRQRIKAIAAPTTVIYAHDAIMPIAPTTLDRLYQEQYEALPDTTLVRIDDSFHFVMLDQPEAFYEALDTALAPLAGAAEPEVSRDGQPTP